VVPEKDSLVERRQATKRSELGAPPSTVLAPASHTLPPSTGGAAASAASVTCVEAMGMTSACWPGGRGMSSAGELSAMTLTGVDQAPARLARCDTQMSFPPAPPARSDPNQ